MLSSVFKELKKNRRMALRRLEEQEQLILSLYSALRNRDEEALEEILSTDIVRKIPSVLAGDVQLPELYDFLVEAERSGIHLLHHCYPYEVLRLAGELLDSERGTTVYNPYPDAYGFAYWFSKYKKTSVVTVDPYKTSIPKFLTEHSRLKINYSFEEPLCSKVKNEYDYAVSFVWRSEPVFVKCENSPENRKIKGWKDVLVLKHLFLAAKKKVLLFLPSSFLIRIREAFVDARRLIVPYLEQVILLPSNIFFDSYASYCILVLSKESFGLDKKTLFIDASSFYELDGYGRKNILDYRRLLSAVKSKESKFTIEILRKELFQFDDYLRLHPKFYLGNAQKYFKILQGISNKVPLKEVVEDVIASPFAGLKREFPEGEEKSVFEVQVSDIPEDGIVKKTSVKRRRNLDLEEAQKFLIRPNDILLSVRGATGKVGIVLEVPKNEIWIPSQTLVIIRPDPKKINPYALFLFLRSDVGQFLLELAKSGETLSFMPLQIIKNIEIPNFSKEQQQKLADHFKKEVLAYQEIEKIKTTISKEREKVIETFLGGENAAY